MAETPDPAPTPEPPKVDLAAERAKEGNWEAVARSLAYKVDERERDNYRLREQKRELKALIPDEGALVLPPEKAAEFKAFSADLEAAGLDTADKLRAHLDAFQTNAVKVAAAEKAKTFATVAEVTGTSADALPDVFASGETFEIRGEGEGRTVYVKPAPEAEAVPFEAYVDEKKAALKPALYTTPEAAAPAAPVLPPMRAGGVPPAPKGPATPDEIAQTKRRSPEYAAMI